MKSSRLHYPKIYTSEVVSLNKFHSSSFYKDIWYIFQNFLYAGQEYAWPLISSLSRLYSPFQVLAFRINFIQPSWSIDRHPIYDALSSSTGLPDNRSFCSRFEYSFRCPGCRPYVDRGQPIAASEVLLIWRLPGHHIFGTTHGSSWFVIGRTLVYLILFSSGLTSRRYSRVIQKFVLRSMFHIRRIAPILISFRIIAV